MKIACVIDDHAPSRVQVIGVLRESGYAVIGEASSGARAVSFTHGPS